MAVALLVWVAWIIKMKYEVSSRRYENACDAYSTNNIPFSFMLNGIFFREWSMVNGEWSMVPVAGKTKALAAEPLVTGTR
jgi:hypothetical protein